MKVQGMGSEEWYTVKQHEDTGNVVPEMFLEAIVWSGFYGDPNAFSFTLL